MSKAVVLASGGLDSCVTAAMAKAEGHELYFLTIHYGQRHQVEVECAERLANFFHVSGHQILHVDLRAFGGSALTSELSVPTDRSEADRDQAIPLTYVPARNTIFLSLALAYAEVLQASMIYFGANIRDYSGYPDCRPEYIRAFMEVARLGTRLGIEGHPVKIMAPLLMMTKSEIIHKGQELGVPFHLTSSCYNPGPQGQRCGRCDSCLIREEGFQRAGIPDPIQPD